MGNKTKIEWADATWNPVTGCTKLSAGCAHCYAERMVGRGKIGRTIHGSNEFGKVTLHPDRLDAPLHWRKPRRLFVCSMGDLFHPDVPFEFIEDVFDVMASRTADCGKRGRHVHDCDCWGGPFHTFIVLTKRPDRMREFYEWVACREYPRETLGLAMEVGQWPLPNVWLGVSAENQAAADERVPLLLQTPAAVRFVSVEPMLGAVDLSCHLACKGCGTRSRKNLRPGYIDCCPDGGPMLDWVICGGESGPKARPMHPDWARSLRDRCVAAQVPFLFKQWGEWSPYLYRPGCEVTNAPGSDDIRHRMNRVGKKAAGRELDGVAWDQYPKAATGGGEG